MCLPSSPMIYILLVSLSGEFGTPVKADSSVALEEEEGKRQPCLVVGGGVRT